MKGAFFAFAGERAYKTLLRIAGDWFDFSGVQHGQIGGDTVIPFRVHSNEALQDLIVRLELVQGVPFGNMDETSESALRSAGYNPNRFKKYYTFKPWFIFLYVDSDECVLVRINL